jgi:hypothetical protein
MMREKMHLGGLAGCVWSAILIFNRSVIQRLNEQKHEQECNHSCLIAAAYHYLLHADNTTGEVGVIVFALFNTNASRRFPVNNTAKMS